MSRRSRSRSATSTRNSRTEKDENSAPWPEWSDAFLNTTVWNPFDVPPPTISKKGGTAQKTAQKTARTSTVNKAPSRSGSVRRSLRSFGGINEDNCFSDGWSRNSDIFAGAYVSKWVRAEKVVGLKTTLIYNPKEVNLDMISSNKHLMDHKALKEIIECISCLYIASLSWPFPAEFRSPDFSPPADTWKPWHHVYSKRSGGGGDGYPSYNEYGRYVVRLYFLGKWRRIEVDDFFPIDCDGNLLLPISCSNDLWFPILSKAILRVVSVFDDYNITVITALTGWIKNRVSFQGANLNEIWNVCCSYLLKNNELLPSNSDDIHCTYYGGSCLNDIRHLRESKIQKVFVFARITERKYNLEDIEPFERHLFTFVDQVTQNWIRVEDYPSWKEHRWFDWAYNHNILRGKIGQIFKYIQVYSPLWIADWECKEIETSSFINRESYVEETNLSSYFKEWEFEKFKDCINEFELYYLPSQFEHSYRTETLTSIDVIDKPKIDSKGRTPSRTLEQIKPKISISGSSRFLETSCTSFYLLVDSPYCKKIYVDMMFLNSLEEFSQGHVICEKFDWKDDRQGIPVFLTKTQGSITHIINAGPGRHTFKILAELPQQYFIQFYSNTPFTLEYLEGLQEKLQDDSVSFKLYANQISEAFRELTKTDYASENHSQALKKYMESFYPTDLRQKTHLHQSLIYRIPFDKLLEESMTEYILGTDIMKSYENTVTLINKIRRLFLNPSFGEEILMEVEYLNPANNSVGSNAVTSAKATPKTKEKAKTAQPSNEMFFDKFESNLAVLKIIMAKDKSFLTLYPFCFDNETKIVYHEYKGKAEIQNIHPFFVAARLILNVHTEELTSCGIYPFLNHDFWKVSVYDIATMNMIPVKFNKNSIWKIQRSSMGYLILLMCFNQIVPSKIKATEIPWRIRFVSYDEESLLHPCRLGILQQCNLKPPSPQFVSETIRGYYLPNEHNIVTKFLITITHSDIITLQLTVSCPSAIINVVLIDAQDNVVRESEGKGNLLMPSIILNLNEAFEDAGNRYYSGEVQVKHSSWELTPKENAFVNLVKESYVPFSDVSSAGKGKKRKSKFSANSSHLPSMELDDTVAPMWNLTIITEQAPRDKGTKVIPDTRIFDNFKLSEMASTDNDRIKKGSELRSNFKALLSEEAEDEQTDETDQLKSQYDYYINLLSEYTIS